MEKLKLSDFRIEGKAQLRKRATAIDLNAGKEQIETALNDVADDLGKLQERMYAHNRYGVLVCLQGMDTAGKDSLIREVFKSMNVSGVVVQCFKQPSSTELQHDYLWRHYTALPERGTFCIFNRTHYENVLVTRVHPEYILHENLPGITSVEDIDKDFWKRRFRQINNFERHLVENGTIVLKFFLHMSKEEQRQRILRRLEKESHNWKFSPSDLNERDDWEAYEKCYDDAIGHTSTAEAPWYVIPADDKPAARLIVARIIREALSKYDDIEVPELEPAIEKNLSEYIEQLEKEKPGDKTGSS